MKKEIKIIEILKEFYPDAKCSLDFETPFQIMVAVVLSAQCTDARVNLVTPSIFKKYPEAKDFANMDISLLEELTETTDKLKALNDFKHSGIISNENVYACIQYIDNHLNEPLSVEKISHELKVSTSHLSHSFKKEIGIPIKKYITNQKLFLAQKLLQQGNSAQEVANSLGYEYYSTFYQQYVKRFRISPNDQATRPRIMLEDVKFDNGI